MIRYGLPNMLHEAAGRPTKAAGRPTKFMATLLWSVLVTSHNTNVVRPCTNHQILCRHVPQTGGPASDQMGSLAWAHPELSSAYGVSSSLRAEGPVCLSYNSYF